MPCLDEPSELTERPCLRLWEPLTLAGVAGGFVMFLHPWRSCPEIDDSSAGCPATRSDQGLLGVAVLVLLVGIVLLALFMSIWRERIPSDAAGSFGTLH